MTFPRENQEPIEVGTIPEDTKYIGDRLDAMTALLTQLVEADVARENPAPSMLMFFGAAGQQLSNIVTQTVRFRATGILMTPNGGGIIDLRVGSARVFNFNLTNDNGTRYFPFPYVFDVGTDVQFDATVNFAAAGFFAAIIGYPEK